MSSDVETRLRALERAVEYLLRDARATEEKDKSTLYSVQTWDERLDAVCASPTLTPTAPARAETDDELR
jgi:hypothetical protein